MTSNIGAHLIQETLENLSEKNRDAVIATAKNKVFELLKKSIRPEFLNRIDEIIMFSPLTRDEINGIVKLQFNHVQKLLLENDIKIQATTKALEWLAELGYDPQFGARPLKRVMQKKLLNELSKQIIGGKINKEDHILIELDKNKNFIFSNVKEPELV